MFYKHIILKVNNENVLYLYLTNYQEFSNEFTKPQKKEDLYSKIKKYIETKKINFDGKKIMFVVNGLIIGSLMLATNSLNNMSNSNIPFQKLNIDKDYIIETNHNKEKKETTRNVYIRNKQGHLDNIPFDHYLTTIIAMKIPPTYNTEAIKAMAVLLRTNAFKEIYENKFLSNHNNLYQNINILKESWKDKYEKYYNKLYQIVLDTNNEYLAHHNYFLNTSPTKIPNNYTIGLNNYGANLMAKAGYNYIEILKHYYPTSNVFKL